MTTNLALLRGIEHAHQCQDYASILKLYAKLQQQQELTTAQWIDWSNAAKSLQQLADALHILHQVPPAQRLNSDYFIALGKLCRDSKDYNQALQHFAQAYEVDHGCDNALCQSGIIYELQLNFSAAAGYYVKALGIAPENGMHWLGYAKCLQAQQLDEQAGLAFDNAERYLAKDTDYNKACLYALRAQTDNALIYLNRFCQQNPFASKWAEQDPDLTNLTAHPQFAAALNGQL